jgi:hypothetical protein
MCACAGALTASAKTNWVEDTFEELPIDTKAGLYKYEQWGAPNDDTFTNRTWLADESDASIIVAGNDSYAGDGPIEGSHTQTKVLKLETEGQTLTRYVNFDWDGGFTYPGQGGKPLSTPASIPFSANPIYVDTLIKFTPSEDEPSFEDDGYDSIKLAIWVNVDSNLVVRHMGKGIVVEDAFDSVDVTNTVFNAPGDPLINPEQWYRLTVELKDAYQDLSPGVIDAFAIRLDGTYLTSTNGYEMAVNGVTSPDGGKWFTPVLYGELYLNQVSFQGTGYVDDLVVTDELAPFGSDTGILLTLAYDETLLNVLVGSTRIGSNGTVLSGSTLAISAVGWYTVGAVTGTGIEYDAGTGVITADAADRTATIEAVLATDSAVSTGTSGYPNGSTTKIAAWALKNELEKSDFDDDRAGYLDDYLLNVAPGRNATLKITGIELDGANAIITVKVADREFDNGVVVSEVDDDEFDFEEINGELWVITTDNLANDFTVPGTSYTITPDPQTGYATITVPNAAGKFIKAVVK